MDTVKLRDKVRGTFLGIAIGDALGKPAETLKASYIAEKWGKITDYIDNSGHKYFDGDMKGTWTDDTQLSLAVARAFLRSGTFDNKAIAEEHASEFMVNIRGWGGTTREAIARIVDGKAWDLAGFTNEPKRGTGNGVCMKVAPVGLWMALTNPQCSNPAWSNAIKDLVLFSIMTHRTCLAITSGLAHAFATIKCFQSEPQKFDRQGFARTICAAGLMGKKYMPETTVDNPDDLCVRFDKLELAEEYTDSQIVNEFGGGSCYVYDSLPFTYMFFARDPFSINSLYDCVSAGGDTDTNGSMLASLLGSLHGMAIFPEHLVNGLDQKDMILQVADQFYERFSNGDH